MEAIGEVSDHSSDDDPIKAERKREMMEEVSAEIKDIM